MSHTPGPWHIKDIGERWETYCCWITVGPASVEYMGKWDDKQGRYVPEDNEMADARLIAAAPELLEVCEGMESVYVFIDSITAGHEPQHTNVLFGLERLRAVIAKAKGIKL